MMTEQGNYLAAPSGQCCLKGSLHQGDPRGEHTTVADVETYIARPDPFLANGHILFYFPDVWGFFTNGFLIMDGFADAGYLTIALDYFRGVRILPHPSSVMKLSAHHVLGSCVETPQESARSIKPDI